MPSNGTTAGTVTILVDAHWIQVYHSSGYFDYPTILVAHFTIAMGWQIENKVLWATIVGQQSKQIDNAVDAIYAIMPHTRIIGFYGLQYSKN